MMGTWWKRCDGQTDRRTDRQTDWTSHIAAWSQLKSKYLLLLPEHNSAHNGLTTLKSQYKMHQIPKLKCFSYCLAVVFAQSNEARCSVENEDVVGAAPTGDAPTTSEWSTILLPTKVRLILETWRYSPEGRVRSTRAEYDSDPARWAQYFSFWLRYHRDGLPYSLFDEASFLLHHWLAPVNDKTQFTH